MNKRIYLFLLGLGFVVSQATAQEIPLKEKKITSEVCVHHLWFSDKDYKDKQSFIKWNPAIKTEEDRDGLWDSLLDDRIDVIATDHAPHTLEEKSKPYLDCPSGGPLVQHALVSMIQHHLNNKNIPPKWSSSIHRTDRYNFQRLEKHSHDPMQCQ